MSELSTLAPRLEQRLNELIATLDVPGAAVGVSHRGERAVVTAGIENLRSGHPVIPATAFQVGSISKVYTTTLLAAVTDLDDALLASPVAQVVPEAEWMDRRITVEHLLTHSSGLAGDCFADTGRGEDALARYVTQLKDLPHDFPSAPGSRYSYCNSGFAVLGRLIEVLTGMTYDAALATHLLQPLAAAGTSLLPEETLLRPHAMGHNRFSGTPLQADDVWHFARALDPVGGICATAADLLTFGEMHLADGAAADGTQVIPAGSARRMRERILEAPRFARPSARGLGWGIYDTDQGQIIGHDGETLGQIAKLRIVPDRELAFVVLTNAIPDGDRITREFEATILGNWGTTLTPVDVPVVEDFDPRPYVGRYRNFEGLMEITAHDRGLKLRNVTDTDGLWDQEHRSELTPIGDDAFIDASESVPESARRFGDRDAGGRCQSYFNGRVFWRINEA